jgi:5'-deoxynucleotidase YfbR-like HD superfamily hydrolase
MKIVTSSGEIIPLLGSFKPNIYDIAHSLSLTNRYSGHTSKAYSVAQHSVLVSQHVPSHFAFQALLHDAHEAYCCDLPKPTKEVVNHLSKGGWNQFEDHVASVVRRHYGLPVSCHKEVKKADEELMLNEIGSLFNDRAKSSFLKLGFTPKYNMMIVPVSSDDAYELFMSRFRELSSGIE